tara:strand:- start:404 stop:700 length:297 start_codon:yes stop_codon:yes gene_type:complete
MFKPVISSIFLLFTQPLYAETPIERCMVVGDLATAIMQGRQLGTPIAKLIEIAEDNDFAIALVLLAYGQPRYSTPEYQQRAADEFGSDIVVACMSGLT